MVSFLQREEENKRKKKAPHESPAWLPAGEAFEVSPFHFFE